MSTRRGKRDSIARTFRALRVHIQMNFTRGFSTEFVREAGDSQNGPATESGERPNWKLVSLQLEMEHSAHEIEVEDHRHVASANSAFL
jgi:hypothetical protein